jgi:hypothetical protein
MRADITLIRGAKVTNRRRATKPARRVDSVGLLPQDFAGV